MTSNTHWTSVGKLSDLVAGSGVGARIDGRQIALFYLPGQPNPVLAIDNYCPFSRFHLLARGVVGDIAGEPVVASPLYKQHFSLMDGRCIEQPEIKVDVFPSRIWEGMVQVQAAAC
jgi:nitrite reductase (NADH) small subunit